MGGKHYEFTNLMFPFFLCKTVFILFSPNTVFYISNEKNRKLYLKNKDSSP